MTFYWELEFTSTLGTYRGMADFECQCFIWEMDSDANTVDPKISILIENVPSSRVVKHKIRLKHSHYEYVLVSLFISAISATCRYKNSAKMSMIRLILQLGKHGFTSNVQTRWAGCMELLAF